MKVLYFDERRLSPEEEAKLGVEFATKEQILKEADFVSLHVPLLPSTRHLISEKELNMMKKTAIREWSSGRRGCFGKGTQGRSDSRSRNRRFRERAGAC